VPRVPKPYAHKGWYRTNAGGVQGYKLCTVQEGPVEGHRSIGSLTEQDGIAFKKWVLTEREWSRGGAPSCGRPRRS
jgi:hypothetical protein